MFTRGIIHEGIKYIEIIQDLDDIKGETLEDSVYCKLVEISMNVNSQVCVSGADNYINQLTNNVKFPRDNNFKYANILHDKLFLSEFIQWLNLIDISLFNFESIPVYDISIEIENYIQFDTWISELDKLKDTLIKRSNSLQMM
jgi:hypothetical protein